MNEFFPRGHEPLTQDELDKPVRFSKETEKRMGDAILHAQGITPVANPEHLESQPAEVPQIQSPDHETY